MNDVPSTAVTVYDSRRSASSTRLSTRQLMSSRRVFAKLSGASMCSRASGVLFDGSVVWVVPARRLTLCSTAGE